MQRVHVKRLSRAIALVMLCLLVAAPSVQAAPKTPSFAGAWTSIDVDGSRQHLNISGGPKVHITYIDLMGTICVRNGSPTTVFNASATATITGNTMVLTYKKAHCGPVDLGMVGNQETWTYRPATDQLWNGHVVWTRKGS